MKKLYWFISIICLLCAAGCQKEDESGVIVDGVNIAGTWVLTEEPNDITWYWEITRDHIAYYEVDGDSYDTPYFSKGYVYNNGNSWRERMCVKYELDGRDIYVSDMRMVSIKKVYNKNKVRIESSVLKDGICERVYGFK